MSHILSNYQHLKNKVSNSCSNSVDVVCVTKYSSVQEIKQLSTLKEPLIFGESKVQVAKEKIPLFKQEPHISWHLIGHLQSNKAKLVVELFDVIQSVDSIKLANALNVQAKKQNKVQEIFLQINAANESQKHGLSPEKIDFFLENIKNLKHLNLSGLMCMAPLTDNNQVIRETFLKTYDWFLYLKKKLASVKHLSMGMSQDYQEAIACGSTMIRCGSIVFKAQKL